MLYNNVVIINVIRCRVSVAENHTLHGATTKENVEKPDKEKIKIYAYLPLATLVSCGPQALCIYLSLNA